jgi:hypothetical protein
MNAMPSITLERVNTGNSFAENSKLRTIWNRDWIGHIEADTLVTSFHKFLVH